MYVPMLSFRTVAKDPANEVKVMEAERGCRLGRGVWWLITSLAVYSEQGGTMRWRWSGRAVVIITGILIASSAYATTYYVDYANGSDSNSGTSETTAWKHAPGMEGLTPTGSSTGDGCSSNCASYTPKPGDKIILRGGVVWPYTVAPWNFTWSGSGSTSKYGCQGSGCIYVGNAVGAGLPAWNSGTVTGIWLVRDLGGWNPSSPPSVSCSGGGGSGAAATAYVVPSGQTDSSTISGFLYNVALTNGGSGYTSAPTCTLSGTGTGTLGADIDRAIFDLGAKQGSPPIWPAGQCSSYPTVCSPPIHDSGEYVIFSGLEVRNMEMAPLTGSGIDDSQIGFIGVLANNVTASNDYTHGFFLSCVLAGNCTSGIGDHQHWGILLNNPYGEAVNNVVENGDAVLLGTSTTQTNGYCTSGQLCTYGNFGIGTGTQGGQGPVSIHGNRLYASSWQIRVAGNDYNNPTNTDPFLIYGNESWMSLYQMNSTAHINRQYSQLVSPATLISYNNIDHNHILGSGNQQQCPTGVTMYFFNEVIWGVGTSTGAIGIDTADAGGGGCTSYLLNDTLEWGIAPYNCAGLPTSSVATTQVVENLHCITGPSALNPFWALGTGPLTEQNYAGSTLSSVIQASAAVQSESTANGQGYHPSNLYAPTTSGGATVTFASGSGTINLTSLCSGNLAALCEDINGNARPGTGGWQAGAYEYGSGGSSGPPPATPTGLTAVVN
jgi:hypothetical protein